MQSLTNHIKNIAWKSRLTFAQMTRYEYWPWWLFYLPCIPYWLMLSVKTRSLIYFTAVNPGIYLGGFFGESKKNILSGIPEDYLPKTLFFEKGSSPDQIIAQCKVKGIHYPFILKPDIGERGNQVEKISTEAELINHSQQITEDFIIQEFIDYPIELGVLYHRYPFDNRSGITSVTMKEFLAITGDGQSTLERLVKQSIRASFQYERLKNKFTDCWSTVLPKGEKFTLEPIGNHCRGTMFINRNELINNQLTKVFDKISKDIPGFFYGRYDLKVKSIEDLYKGENIRIMELNGVSSEPAHIYDPSFPIIKAYRELFRHMKISAKISTQNQQLGITLVPVKDVCKEIYRHFVKR